MFKLYTRQWGSPKSIEALRGFEDLFNVHSAPFAVWLLESRSISTRGTRLKVPLSGKPRCLKFLYISLHLPCNNQLLLLLTYNKR